MSRRGSAFRLRRPETNGCQCQVLRVIGASAETVLEFEGTASVRQQNNLLAPGSQLGCGDVAPIKGSHRHSQVEGMHWIRVSALHLTLSTVPTVRQLALSGRCTTGQPAGLCLSIDLSSYVSRERRMIDASGSRPCFGDGNG